MKNSALKNLALKNPALKNKCAGVRKGTHQPPRPARLKRAYDEDDDSFDVPETALGGAKD
ncbi:MAG: hypothetical protein IT566_17365 [Rhodospirillaceae bacterium]|nr:hypothetical protein [Rhodospirillaceae bacterium]